MPKVTKEVQKEDETTKKRTTRKRKQTTQKTTVENKVKSVKASTKKEAASKVASAKKKTTSSTPKKTTKGKQLESNIVAEYYDLPYRYNETIVKILYQTPTVLFVYWDIADQDKENFRKTYGEHFFDNTKPILKVFNLTMNYHFEVEINDFANSWYIHVNDANCDYKVELARRTIQYEENLNTDYISISSSNHLAFPNDHILIDELPATLKFRNVKTNTVTMKEIRTLHLIGIRRIYHVYDFYQKLYNDEILEEIKNRKIINPSSSSWS